MTAQEALAELAEAADRHKHTQKQWNSLIDTMLHFDYALYREDRQKFLDGVLIRCASLLEESIEPKN